MRGVSTWHIVISGFLQDQGQPTGLVKLWAKLQQFAAAATAVQLYTWDADWDAVAEFLWQTQPESAERISINVYAFSWGAGSGAMQLAWALHHRGLAVDVMILADPVYRHPYWLGNWRAFVPGVPIVVPPNVQVVHSFAQSQSWPRAHPLIAHDADRTIIFPPIECACGHAYMDDEPGFHRAAIWNARALQ